MQVPFGPKSGTRPQVDSDPRMPLAADNGPWSDGAVAAWEANQFDNYNVNTSPTDWKAMNSPNHGGRGVGEGQYVVHADASARFERKPVVGVDFDNIYTRMRQPGELGADRWVGEKPDNGDSDPYPGYQAFFRRPKLDHRRADLSVSGHQHRRCI